MGMFGTSRGAAPAGETRSFPAMSVNDYLQIVAAGGSDSADKLVAVAVARDLISSIVSELPVDVFWGSGSGRVQVPASSVAWLQDPGGDGYGVESWVYQFVDSHLGAGNCWSEPLAFGGGGAFPTAMRHLRPLGVSPTMTAAGDLAWMAESSEWEPWSPATGWHLGQLLHTRSFERTGDLLGRSVIRQHMELTISPALAAARFGKSFFEGAAIPKALFQNDSADLTPEQAADAKAKLIAQTRNTRDPLVLGKGWKYSALSIPPEEAQFLETQRMSAAESARMFGPGVAEILGYETGAGAMTYANVESKLAHLLALTVSRWIRKTERILTLMTPRPMYVKLNRDALMETTTAAKLSAYHQQLTDQWRTVNEIRELEDLEPVEWGDLPLPAVSPIVIQQQTPDSTGGQGQ